MHYPLRLLLGAPPWITDPDARDFIQRVEADDGAALEDGIKLAYADFIRGCKADGTWNAIKASCILAGARTLSGALVPLVGTAPTNFNFVSGDYNRKTGLVGNGTTKYLNSNRAGNADPQNDYHSSVFLSYSTASTQFYLGQVPEIAIVSPSITMRIPNSARVSVGSPVIDFIGGARSSSSEFRARLGGVTSSFAVASATPAAGNVLLFAGTPSIINSDARLAFYSIGESLDLALLDARVTALINAFAAAIP